MTKNISRRHLAQGAAWAAPAVVIASSAPAASASEVPEVPVACSMTPTGTITGSKTYSSVIGALNTYDPVHAGSLKKGTFYTLELGMFQFNQPFAPDGSQYTNITGYRIAFNGTAYVQTGDGTKSTVQVNQVGTRLAQVINAGLQQSINFQSQIPYNGVVWERTPANFLQNISIPVCLTYLRWLTAVETASNECCFYLNISYKPTKSAFAYQTDTWSYSVAPLYA